MASKAVVLLSGGLDSYTAAAVARRDGFELFALTINYGQRHAQELAAAQRVAASLGTHVSFAKPARDAFLAFAQTAPWHANFRDFNAAIRRMATLADGGRIDA